MAKIRDRCEMIGYSFFLWFQKFFFEPEHLENATCASVVFAAGKWQNPQSKVVGGADKASSSAQRPSGAPTHKRSIPMQDGLSKCSIGPRPTSIFIVVDHAVLEVQSHTCCRLCDPFRFELFSFSKAVTIFCCWHGEKSLCRALFGFHDDLVRLFVADKSLSHPVGERVGECG